MYLKFEAKNNKMKIGIIGSGSMGANIGRIWANCGHQIMFSYSRNEEKLNKLAEDAGNNAKVGNPKEAVAFGDVILLSVPWSQVSNALKAAGDLEDKVLFTCVNALKPDMSGLEVGTTTSAAEEIAKLAPKAKVVEALPPFSQILASDSRRIANEQPTAFYCGDDPQAKAIVARLLEELDLEAVDAGGLINARYLEPSGVLTIQLGYGMNMGTRLSLKLIKED